MKKESIFGGSLILGVGAFVSKLLGALYRIPLLNLIGSNGVGLYQMVFPVYCILLDFAGAGAPNALAKIISENSLKTGYAEKVLKSSIKLLLILGITCTAFMLFLSYPISCLQGNKNAYLGYIFLSPAVLFVALISAYRGYFQGKLNMFPTSVSQVTEQLVKLIFGLLFAYLFKDNIPFAVGGATFAVSVSEGVALLSLYLKYKRETKFIPKVTLDLSEKKELYRKIIKLTIPFTLVGIALPFSNFIDSFYIVNILKRYSDNATSLYGLYSGASMTVINLPVSICYGISVVIVPVLSKGKNISKKIRKSILFTLILAIPMAVFCFFFSGFITKILYKNMSVNEKAITSTLIKITSLCIIFLSLLQTQNSILISMGKKYFPLLSIIIGVIIKTVLTVILLFNEQINIYAVGYGLIACYFVSVLINFIMIKGIKKDAS